MNIKVEIIKIMRSLILFVVVAFLVSVVFVSVNGSLLKSNDAVQESHRADDDKLCNFIFSSFLFSLILNLFLWLFRLFTRLRHLTHD